MRFELEEGPLLLVKQDPPSSPRPSFQPLTQGSRHVRECNKNGSVFRDQRHPQLLRSSHKLAVVGTAAAAVSQLQNLFGRHGFVLTSQQRLYQLHQCHGLRELEQVTP